MATRREGECLQTDVRGKTRLIRMELTAGYGHNWAMKNSKEITGTERNDGIDLFLLLHSIYVVT